jgi:hypothetical protein
VNRLFSRLRNRRDNIPVDTLDEAVPDALPGFEARLAVLYGHAQQAARYEDELLSNRTDVADQLQQYETRIEQCIARGEDRKALEYVRLAARLRPQYDLLDNELRAFTSVANALTARLDLLLQHVDEARQYAQSAALNAQATYYLDLTLTRLTRYFVLLERVAAARRHELPDRLAASMLQVIDDRRLDLALATYILQRRQALKAGDGNNDG